MVFCFVIRVGGELIIMVFIERKMIIYFSRKNVIINSPPPLKPSQKNDVKVVISRNETRPQTE